MDKEEIKNLLYALHHSPDFDNAPPFSYTRVRET